MDKEVQILIDDKIMRLFAAPSDLFAVINGLILHGKNPQVRLFDEELNDWTCWQPTQPQKQEKTA